MWLKPSQKPVDVWRQWLTKEGWGGDRPVAPGHHDADPRLDEGHREVYDLWPLLVDGERPHRHVSVLQHHLEEEAEASSARRDLSRYSNSYFGRVTAAMHLRWTPNEQLCLRARLGIFRAQRLAPQALNKSGVGKKKETRRNVFGWVSTIRCHQFPFFLIVTFIHWGLACASPSSLPCFPA